MRIETGGGKDMDGTDNDGTENEGVNGSRHVDNVAIGVEEDEIVAKAQTAKLVTSEVDVRVELEVDVAVSLGQAIASSRSVIADPRLGGFYRLRMWAIVTSLRRWKPIRNR